MTILEAVILGLVEGVTEFLPVSSTGHLIIASELLGLGGTETSDRAVDAFSIIIQGGAILAVAWLYWPRIVQMIRGLLGYDEAGRRLLVNLLVAFLPAAVLGVMLEEWISSRLMLPGPVIAALFLGGIVLLFLRRWQDRLFRAHGEPSGSDEHAPVTGLDALSWRQALIIGGFQCVAMWPGTSRSMMTIIGGMLVGLKPRDAAEFGFLLGLPTLGGACVYKAVKNFASSGPNMLEVLGPAPVIVGALTAMISAMLAVRWLVGYLSRHGVSAFGWYRIGLAIILLGLVAAGMIQIDPDHASEEARGDARSSTSWAARSQ